MVLGGKELRCIIFMSVNGHIFPCARPLFQEFELIWFGVGLVLSLVVAVVTLSIPQASNSLIRVGGGLFYWVFLQDCDLGSPYMLLISSCPSASGIMLFTCYWK